ncbi:phage tail tape measure protein [Mannheimia bovis]|uniref:phage tail tape measure protein n=1 Tax=Mannheimia bovis TaxID=2770636 RepID=UPI0024B72EFE|nr:phage tail tape measure protein [Mannheimia bovis]WHP46365.1 phage tail tape measure protein [Mannheimia bovis]
MSSLGQLNISLTLESTKFQSALSKSDYEAQKFARNFVLNMDQATAKAKQFAQRTTDYLSNIEQAAKNINTATKWEFRFNNFDRVKNIASTYSKIADSYTELGNKLRLVTENEAQHARAMADVYDISLKTAQSTEATSSVYQTFAQNAKQLGISQNDVAKLTATVAKSVAISGASSATASNALVQFSQSLLMGKMKAQEFNSLMTQTPSVVQAIAKGLGITTSELKAMVDNGEMSAEKMIEGLKKAESYVNGQYAKTTSTISGAMQNLSTATEKWVGEMDNATGASSIAASAINGLANNLSTLTPYLLNIGVAWAGIKLGQRTKEIYDTTAATIQKANATKIAAQNTLQQVQSELAFARSSMQSLTAQLQLARTERERTLIRQQMKAQSAEIIALTNAEAAATQNLSNAKKSANLLSGAMSMLGGPIGLVTMGLTFGATALWDWYQSGENARQKALEFAQSLDQIKERLPQMTKLELEVSINDTQDSIKAQKEKIKEITKELEQLEKKASQTKISYYYAGQIHEVAKSAEQMRKEMAAVTAKKRELEIANQDLGRTEESLATQIKNVPLTEMRQQFVDLYPHIDQSQIKVDGLNLSIGNFTVKSPEMVVAANNIATALGGVAGEAMKAAILVANLSNMKLDINGAAVIDPKHLETIEQIERNNAIGSAKGKDKIALQVKDALIRSGMKEGDAGYERLKAAYEQQFTLQNASKGSGKPKKTKAEKEAEKAAKKQQRDAERSAESYQNQVAEMTNRLAGLKANAADIAIFGQVSDYQEVRKLTEDIAINAEKYKGYGEEGVARLKELAGQLDSAQQQVAISQFTYNNGEKLKAMEFELSLLGKTRKEQELIQYNHELDLEAARLKIGMSKENIALLEKEIEALKKRRAEIQAQAEEARGSWEEGIKQGWNNIEADVSNVAANVANITENAFNGMADAMTDFVMTGKADFKSMAASIIRDISNMIIKMTLFKALENSLRGTSFGNFLGIPVSSAAQGGLIGSVGMPKVMLGGFSRGGYTGDGGKYVPAGLVHRGEYVITKEATARLGLDFLNHLNYGKRGFSSGGGVAVPRVPSISLLPAGSNKSSPSSSINVTQHYTIDARGADHGVEQRISDLLKQNKRETIAEIRNQIRRGGQFGKDFGVA